MSYDFGGGFFTGDFGIGSTKTFPIFIAGYYRRANTGTDGWPVEFRGNSGNQGNSLAFRARDSANTLLQLVASTDSTFATGSNWHTPSPASEVDDVWVPFIVEAKTASQRRVYVLDRAKTAEDTTALTFTNQFRYFNIGQRGNGAGTWYGKAAEIVVGNFELTNAEIDNWMAGQAPSTVFSARSAWWYYPLISESTTQSDASGNGGPTLTLSGTATHSADHPIAAAATAHIFPVNELLAQKATLSGGNV